MNADFMINFSAPVSGYVVTIEDDGKTGYAYLKKKSTELDDLEIVGYVWLYNRIEAPSPSEWQNVDNIPFANCIGYVSADARVGNLAPANIQVDWEEDSRGPVAFIYINKSVVAFLGVDDKPGYSRYATEDSPLAKVMEIED